MTTAIDEFTVVAGLICVEFYRQHCLRTTKLWTSASRGKKEKRKVEVMPNADKSGQGVVVWSQTCL